MADLAQLEELPIWNRVVEGSRPSVSNGNVFNWVKVDERLPDKYVRVLIYNPHHYVGKDGNGFYEVCFYVCKDSMQGATHWMPLPEAPIPPLCKV